MARAAVVIAVVAVMSAGCSTIGGDVQRAMDAYQASDLEKGAELVHTSMIARGR